jgi:4-hydroxybenzoyl-CoA thioesterase
MSYTTQALVRFAHVDAAGIVFYPRYFEMVNAALEDFFADVVGVDFQALHIGRGLGVPTVKLDSEFHAPSRLGDRLDIGVAVERVGDSSATLRFTVTCDGTTRLVVRSVIVCMDLGSARSAPWPGDIRERLSPEPAAKTGGILSPSDRPAVEETPDGYEPGTLDARG